MIRTWRLFWITLWSVLIGFVLTKNLIKYRKERVIWNVGKSFLDTIILVVSAIFLPPFLIAMNVSWLVSKFQRKWVKISVGICAGIVFGVISTYAIELLILLGIFSIDDKTGLDKGILHRWAQVTDEENIERAA